MFENWIQRVFDPLTKARANHKLEHNIIRCRPRSRTSHVTQPLDLSVFGPLKTAYHELVGQRGRGGLSKFGKSYLTLLYMHGVLYPRRWQVTRPISQPGILP